MEEPISPTIATLSRKNSISSLRSSTSSSTHFPRFEGLAPARAPLTVPFEETFISVPGIPSSGDSVGGEGGGVRLKVDARTGCGGITWASGEVLARYLAYRHELDPTYLLNRNIVELGSGTGLVGIAVGLLQPDTKVWVTDQVQLLDLMQRNIILNIPTQQAEGKYGIHALELNWGEDVPQEVRAESVDMVLAADCVYSEAAFPLLVKTLCDLIPLRSNPDEKEVEALFCWKKRRKADRHFFTMLHKHFTSISVEDDRPGEKERYSREGVTLLRLTRKK